MKINIKRFYENESKFQSYEVDVKKDDTILDVLDRINRSDRSLSYRSFCRSAICGSCAMVVNDRTLLVCKVNAIETAQNGELVIEPLKNQKVIKDLVTDIDDSLATLKRVKGWFVSDDSDKSQTPDELALIDKQTDCILCMACWSECEPLENSTTFAGPFAFTKLNRFLNDKRDIRSEDEIKIIAKENGLYECIQCNKCTVSCPKGISSAFDIKNIMNKDMASFGNDFGVNFF